MFTLIFIPQALAHLCLARRLTRLEGCPHQMKRLMSVHTGTVPNHGPTVVKQEPCDTIRMPALTPVQSRKLQNRRKACLLEGMSADIVLFRMTMEAFSTASTDQWVISLLVNIAATPTPPINIRTTVVSFLITF